MPVSIGEVQSEVLVEPAGERVQGGQAQGIPTPQEQARWNRLGRQQQWDEHRTRAQDFDD